MKMKWLCLGLVLSLWSAALFAREYALTTATSGVVQKVMVKAGDKVKQGQVLLMLDQRVLQAKLAAAEKALQSALLDKQEANRELERTQELYDRTVIADHELQLATINYAKAEKAYAEAEKRKIASQYELEYSQVIAPVAGRIKSVKAWSGMVVNNRQTNTTLIVLER